MHKYIIAIYIVLSIISLHGVDVNHSSETPSYSDHDTPSSISILSKGLFTGVGLGSIQLYLSALSTYMVYFGILEYISPRSAGTVYITSSAFACSIHALAFITGLLLSYTFYNKLFRNNTTLRHDYTRAERVLLRNGYISGRLLCNTLITTTLLENNRNTIFHGVIFYNQLGSMAMDIWRLYINEDTTATTEIS